MPRNVRSSVSTATLTESCATRQSGKPDLSIAPKYWAIWAKQWWSICTTHGIRVKTAIPINSLAVHLLDGPAADLQALGQLPLAHSP